MPGLDAVILSAAAASFVVFVLAHLATFRWIPRENIIMAFRQVFIFGWAAGLAVLVLTFQEQKSIPGTDRVLSLAIAAVFEFVIYGLSAFLYVLYIFGPFESSIRFRLVYVLYQNFPRGMEWEEIEPRYNPGIFLRRRLDRLIASGDLVLERDVYRLRHERSIFIVMDEIALKIQRCLTRR